MSEFAELDRAFGIGLGEMEWLTINAMKSAFAPFDERLRFTPGPAHSEEMMRELAKALTEIWDRLEMRWAA